MSQKVEAGEHMSNGNRCAHPRLTQPRRWWQHTWSAGAPHVGRLLKRALNGCDASDVVGSAHSLRDPVAVWLSPAIATRICRQISS